MHDMDDIIPEFESRYHAGPEDQKSETEHDAAGNPAGRNFSVHISRTFPVIGGPVHAGERGDVYLVEQNGTRRILKFFGPGPVRGEEFFRRAVELGEERHEVFLHIYEFGFDENTKRWYAIEEYTSHGSLQDLIDAAAHPDALPRLIQALLNGLNVLHESNIVHLNLKPSNILLRESQPPHPVFSALSLFPMTESDHLVKRPSLADRPVYAAPELLTGTAGREADYWSLGMILLALLLGRHPFDAFDDQAMMNILSAHPLALPERIPEDYMPLLRGLLTKEPGKRWGYPEVKKWLEKDANIGPHLPEAPVETTEITTQGYTVPFRFLHREYFSLPKMIPAFLKSEEAWEAAADHLEKGHIAAWLRKNSDERMSSRIDAMREQYAGDRNLTLIGLIYTFRRDLPFVFYGKLITPKNLSIYAGRSLKHESSGAEESITACLLNGKLSEYYREYAMLTAKEEDELSSLFDAVRKAVSGKAQYPERLAALCKMLNIVAAPAAYLLPAKVRDNIMGNVYTIADNINMVITRETYQEMIGSLIIPNELKEKIDIAISADLGPSYATGLKELRDGSLLTREEFAGLQETCILPEWLTSELLGRETSGYLAAMNLLKKLKGEELIIRKDGFLDYLRNYAQFIGHIFTTTVALPQGKKGESLEQRWFRWLKADIGREEYLTLARHIKNQSVLSLFSRIEAITSRLSEHSFSSDAVKEIVRSLEVLTSGEVRWDENDKQMVNEIHAFITRKESAPVQLLEKITQGVFGKGFRAFLKSALGLDVDERTREMEGAFAGLLGGAFLGMIAWPVIVSLELEMSFTVPTFLGLLSGLIMRSIPLALLLASAGFAGTFFLGMETLMEVLYAFLIALSGAAQLGAVIGRRMPKYSFFENVLRKYHGRITDLLHAAEAASDRT